MLYISENKWKIIGKRKKKKTKKVLGLNIYYITYLLFGLIV